MTGLHPEAFRALRLQAGLSQRKVARLAGVSITTVTSVEEGASDRLSVACAARLAEAIGSSLEELLEAPQVPAAEEPSTDSAQLEALLFAAGKALHLDVLEEVTGWNPMRVQLAVEALHRDLIGRGVRLSRFNRRVGLRPCVDGWSRKHLGALERHMGVRERLNARQASVLMRVAEGEERGDLKLYADTNPDRVALRSLINGGIVVDGFTSRLRRQKLEIPRAGRPQLSFEVRFALRFGPEGPLFLDSSPLGRLGSAGAHNVSPPRSRAVRQGALASAQKRQEDTDDD